MQVRLASLMTSCLGPLFPLLWSVLFTLVWELQEIVLAQFLLPVVDVSVVINVGVRARRQEAVLSEAPGDEVLLAARKPPAALLGASCCQVAVN